MRAGRAGLLAAPLYNASHASRGCSGPNLVSTGGAGLLLASDIVIAAPEARIGVVQIAGLIAKRI